MDRFLEGKLEEKHRQFQTEKTKKNYSELLKVGLASTSFYNKRRSAECANITVQEFQRRKNGEVLIRKGNVSIS